ncbi:FAD-dependent monooxygenase [Nonomuraea sp. NPDC050691]|uniref:FAD-dependent oxidoreductase n=1 Tax=Nonomuraea sp. NPDC050691 TaxID=3155661 RepID=UPI0033DFD087
MRALIIGGGIGGPATAMALLKAGIEPVVHEAYDAPADFTGSFLNTASNGLDALRAVDVDIAARADGFPIPHMELWSGTGKKLGEVENGVRPADGTVSVCVKRGLLQKVLREEAMSRGIAFHYGKRLESYHADPRGGVVATFADGTTATGDLLIGADGIHSRTRHILNPDAPAPTYTGLVGVGGYSRHPGLKPTTGTQHLIFGRKAFFGYLVRESGEIYWFANLDRPVEPTRAELAATDWKRHLAELFAGDQPFIREIIAGSTGPIGSYVVHDIPTSPVWHRGPAVLIGDAAHATSPSAGQGASMAFEDAIVLAKCLRDRPDVPAAFAAYERERRERVEKVVAYSRSLSDSKKAPGPVGRFFRDLMMPIFLKRSASAEAHAWMYRHRITWDSPVAA